jgi:ribonucleoside-diphosphate reductase subunit M2
MGSLENIVTTPPPKSSSSEEQEQEPILMKQTQRFCMFPIRYKQLWEMYKKAEASFWTGRYSSIFIIFFQIHFSYLFL